MNINKKSLGLSFVLTLAWVAMLVVVYYVILAVTSDEGAAEGVVKILNILTAVALTVYSAKIKSSQYKNSAPAWAVFLAIFFLGPIALWFVLYGLLQIKQGLAVRK